MPKYDEKENAVKAVTELEAALDASPEIRDGRWVMLSEKQFEAIDQQARQVAHHLIDCILEMEADD